MQNFQVKNAITELVDYLESLSLVESVTTDDDYLLNKLFVNLVNNEIIALIFNGKYMTIDNCSYNQKKPSYHTVKLSKEIEELYSKKVDDIILF